MLGVREWRVRGPFRDLTLRMVSSGRDEARKNSSAALLNELLFELRHSNVEVFRTLQQVHHALRGIGAPGGFSRSQAHSPQLHAEFERDLHTALRTGRLEIAESWRSTRPAPRNLTSVPPNLGPQPLESEDESSKFEVRFVDEAGQAIDGMEVVFSGGGQQDKQTTDGGGVARTTIPVSFASVSVVNMTKLGELLETRWEKLRTPKPNTDPNARDFVFTPTLSSFSLESDKPQTIILRPQLGNLFAELWDKSGRVLHANRDYTISGPMKLEGTTDERGQLRHEEVPNGDYTLTLTLKHFEGEPDEIQETYQTQLLVLDARVSEPQLRMIGAVPRVVKTQLDMFFDTNKAFLLPSALPAVQKLRQIYTDNVPAHLLVVGHADTKGGSSYNDTLSLERAEATASFLKDDVDAWYKFYGTDIAAQKRWGKVEDHLMIISMPGFEAKPKAEGEIAWFQRTRGLGIDGKAGKETRHALIEEYMSLDGASLTGTKGA
ncbi:MAG TPA: OmpA family protein [Polyangiaceae bacterium]|nr:OmpA family protein [Polyangiaceae bacterium]